jgi:hypothetical protein
MYTLHESPGEGNPSSPDGQVDWREQPYNGREIGPFQRVQLPLAAVVVLHAIVIDLDLHILEQAAVVGAGAGPGRFHEKTLVHWLARHRALDGAEVRDTGRNIHVLLPLAEPVTLAGEGERRRWDGIVRVVPAALPCDPDQPGLTALTRPVGSINSRTGRPVRVLRPGTPTPVADVMTLYDDMADRPFRTVAGILFGTDRVAPCPACKAEGSTLAALDRAGRCYGSCGSVRLERLYDAFLAPRTPRGGEARRAEA